MKWTLFFSFLISANLQAETPTLDPRLEFSFDNAIELIYGKDDRYEVSEYVNPLFVEKARSVALKVSNRKLTESREDKTLYNFTTRKLKQVVPQICQDERFIDQVSLGDCSGFLISPTRLVTAGHCMISEADCSGSKWVFDFKLETKAIKKSNVYSCKKIITQKYVYSKVQVNDYAVIELDRPVFGRAALEYRKFGFVEHDTPLAVIGHPLGLPMKITEGGRVSGLNDIERDAAVRSVLLRRNYFNANLDTFAGNSGSPVFNYETGKVEGILIQGADDFAFNETKGCLESRHLSDDPLNTYEKVMRINHVPGL